LPDTSRFTLALTTVEGTPAIEPDCQISFLRTDDTTARVSNHVAFPPDHTFILPAFPAEKNLICQVNPSLYQAETSGFFIPSEDKAQTLNLVRNPAKWTPGFQALGDLSPARFGPLTRVIDASDDVDVKRGPDLGNFSDAFDNLRGTQQILAKIALLNLYAVLSDEEEPVGNTNWFRFVNKIVRIDQERFVAEADPALLVIVRQIFENLGDFASKGFFTELSAGLHLENIPPRYRLTSDLVTIKVRYEQGNVQFTMSEAALGTKNVVLLDCDMDEHSNIIEHTADLFIHAFSGGTHPIEMHEYIVHHDKGVNLGYDLAPILPEEAVAAVVPAMAAAPLRQVKKTSPAKKKKKKQSR
jgi:hypothetical protein